MPKPPSDERLRKMDDALMMLRVFVYADGATLNHGKNSFESVLAKAVLAIGDEVSAMRAEIAS